MALKEIAEAFLEDSSSGKVGEAFDKYVHKEYMPHIYELYDKYKKTCQEAYSPETIRRRSWGNRRKDLKGMEQDRCRKAG